MLIMHGDLFWTSENWLESDSLQFETRLLSSMNLLRFSRKVVKLVRTTETLSSWSFCSTRSWIHDLRHSIVPCFPRPFLERLTLSMMVSWKNHSPGKRNLVMSNPEFGTLGLTLGASKLNQNFWHQCFDSAQYWTHNTIFQHSSVEEFIYIDALKATQFLDGLIENPLYVYIEQWRRSKNKNSLSLCVNEPLVTKTGVVFGLMLGRISHELKNLKKIRTFETHKQL